MVTGNGPSDAWLVLRHEDPARLLTSAAVPDDVRADIVIAHQTLIREVTGASVGEGDGALDGPIEVQFGSITEAAAAAATLQIHARDPLRQARLQQRAGVPADPRCTTRLHMAIAIAEDRETARALCRQARGGQVLCTRAAWLKAFPERRSALSRLRWFLRVDAFRLKTGRPARAVDLYGWQTHQPSGEMECLYDNPQALLNAPFERMFAAELREWVIPRRNARDEDTHARDPLPFPERPDPRNDLYGVALSGGGMRSAVFSLGVLQALARDGMLAEADYLSTVSGGGYTGVSLAGLCADDLPYTDAPARFGCEPSDFPFAFPRVAAAAGDVDGDHEARDVAERLGPFGLPVHANESPALHHVRGHANLLGHSIGLFDGYTWRSVGRYLASAVILWGLFLLPVVALLGFGALLALEGIRELDHGDGIVIFLAVLPVSLFAYVALANVIHHDPREPYTRLLRWLSHYAARLSGAIVVLMALAASVWLVDRASDALSGATVGAIAGALVAASAGAAGVGLRRIATSPAARRLIWLLAVAIGGYLVLGIGIVAWLWGLWRFTDGQAGAEAWGAAAVSLALVALTSTEWGRQVLNRLSLHDLYAERIGATWVVGAAPPDWQASAEANARPDDNPPDAAAAAGTARYPARWTRVWPRSDLKVGDLAPREDRAPSFPYPLICTALNLPGSRGPKLLDRKAESFVVAPVYSGSALSRWLPTEAIPEIADLSLAAAAAVSGAAVSPNMGDHTSRTLSIVTTLLNVRLGRWIRNPRPSTRGPLGRWFFGRPSTLYWKEMFGLASREDGYVYLSDGGHFDNSGLYELLRRRCRYIVAVMADTESQDEGPLGFGNLGTAIRLARVDFGVEVELGDLKPISRDRETGFVPSFFAAGTIRYPTASPHASAGGEQIGRIVVIKTGLVETALSPDIVSYWRMRNAGFPYDSTLDQQVDQLQFESYRQLGFLAGSEVCRAAGRSGTIEERFGRLVARAGTSVATTLAQGASPVPQPDRAAVGEDIDDATPVLE